VGHSSGRPSATSSPKSAVTYVSHPEGEKNNAIVFKYT
jgi:hypothetical protein